MAKTTPPIPFYPWLTYCSQHLQGIQESVSLQIFIEHMEEFVLRSQKNHSLQSTKRQCELETMYGNRQQYENCCKVRGGINMTKKKRTSKEFYEFRGRKEGLQWASLYSKHLMKMVGQLLGLSGWVEWRQEEMEKPLLVGRTALGRQPNGIDSKAAGSVGVRLSAQAWVY